MHPLQTELLKHGCTNISFAELLFLTAMKLYDLMNCSLYMTHLYITGRLTVSGKYIQTELIGYSYYS